MQHGADVALVDAEAERTGSDDDVARGRLVVARPAPQDVQAFASTSTSPWKTAVRANPASRSRSAISSAVSFLVV